MSSVVIIFTKNPIIGESKTRIMKNLPKDVTIDLAITMLFDTIINILDIDNNYDIVIHCANGTCQEMQQLLESNSYIHKHRHLIKKYVMQSNDKFGKRIKKSISEELQFYKNVIIIGSDCPYLLTNDIKFCLTKLNDEKYDSIIGKTVDGGFYLLGINNDDDYYSSINWSSNTTCNELIGKLKENNNKVFFLPKIYNDIDEVEDLTDTKYFDFMKK